MKVSIITHDMAFIQGSNRVTEKLIFGREQFLNAGIELDKVYTKDGVMNCKEYKPSTLGKIELKTSYKNKRKIIELLKRIPIYNTYLGNKWSVNKNLKNDKRAALSAVKLDDNKTECYLIQGFYVAYYYLKYRKKSSRAKVIMILHTDRDPLEQLLLKKRKLIGTKYEKKLRAMFEFALKNADKVVTICHSETTYLKENYNYTSRYIINGIEDVKADKNIEKLSVKNTKLNFVIVATVQYRKGQDLLIDALKLLPENYKDKIFLHIIGGGMDEQLISKKIIDNSLENCCKMYGPRQDVTELLSTMDVFILPTRADTTPISIIEALRAGLPVISTSVGEIPIMIKDAGIIIEAKVEDIVQVFIDCIEGKYNLLSMAENARNNYNQFFSLEKMIKSYSDLINETLYN